MKSSVSSIETPRLWLRPWKQTDLKPFAEMNACPKVMRYFPELLSRAESDALAEKIQHYLQVNGWGFWAIELKQTGQFIGFTGLHYQPDLFDFSPCTEIGWRLDSKYWHQGFATEAARACLRFAFLNLKLSKVIAFTASKNKPSASLMQRLGMHYEGYFHHPKLDVNNPLCHHIRYAIKQEDFLKNHDEHD